MYYLECMEVCHSLQHLSNDITGVTLRVVTLVQDPIKYLPTSGSAGERKGQSYRLRREIQYPAFMPGHFVMQAAQFYENAFLLVCVYCKLCLEYKYEHKNHKRYVGKRRANIIHGMGLQRYEVSEVNLLWKCAYCSSDV